MPYPGRKSSAARPGPPSPIPPPATVSMVPPPVTVLLVAWVLGEAGADPAEVNVPHAAGTDSELSGCAGSASQSAADVCVWTTPAHESEDAAAATRPEPATKAAATSDTAAAS